MLDIILIATLVNLLALAISLWLGFYIVTRSLHSQVSWLAALTLWSLTSYFFCNAVLDNSPGSVLMSWLRQLVIIVLPFWLHLTYLLLRDRVKLRAQSRLLALNRVAIPLTYVVAVILIALGVLPSNPVVSIFGSQQLPES